MNYVTAGVQVMALQSDAKCCKDGEWQAQLSGATGLRMKSFSPDGVEKVSTVKRFLFKVSSTSST